MGSTRIILEKPIWNRGGEPKVGIAEWRMNADILEVEILYKDKSRHKVFPHIYSIHTIQAMKYPVQVLKGGTHLRIIPIADMKEVILETV